VQRVLLYYSDVFLFETQPVSFSAARADANFRSGLLQGFSAANKQAKSQSCLVRKFAVLTAPLSVQNGELNPDGSVRGFAFLLNAS
jgi:hypothetical protein